MHPQNVPFLDVILQTLSQEVSGSVAGSSCQDLGVWLELIDLLDCFNYSDCLSSARRAKDKVRC